MDTNNETQKGIPKTMYRDALKLSAFASIYVLSVISCAVIGTAVFYQGFKGTRDSGSVFIILLVLIVLVKALNYIRDLVLKKRNKYAGMVLLSSAKVIVPRGEFIDLRVKADTNLYKKDLMPTNTRPDRECLYTVAVEIGEFSKAPQIVLISTYKSKTAVNILNEGMDLLRNGYYMFNIIARSGELINFKFNTEGIVKKFVVEEFYIP